MRHSPQLSLLVTLATSWALPSCTTPAYNSGVDPEQECHDRGGSLVCTAEETGAICPSGSDPGCVCECVTPPGRNNPIPGCEEDADCTGDLICAAGVCVTDVQTPGCLEDADCAGHLLCIRGQCIEDVPPPECIADRDCSGNSVCLDGECVGQPPGPDCVTDAECPGDSRCLNGLCARAPECAEDADCPADQVCVSTVCVPDGTTPTYRFVLIEDLQPPVWWDYPGADIDSVSLIKSDGRIVDAQTVEDFENLTIEGNLATDPSRVLGPPDAACDPNSGAFYAMGGAGSWIMLGFDGTTIDNGDAIDVVELGATECGQFDDEDYAIGIGVSSDDTGTWIEIGECTGSCTTFVSGF